MELIDRNELLREIGQDAESDGNQRAAQILECILSTPTIDAVPVVRCGECKHNPKIRAKNNCPFVYDTDDGDYYTFAMGEDGFCSKGEPRTPPAE